ncbi:tannase/feruloyl esterase family alpha/beta hydrolase [Novosphingobium sediminicola]|uniref:Feruloyl esterase n=1 Tax=Novosphingobium sediminicola TaxID=563162 RepID=A0A7W6G578_9SPHN|nr:tannase/feruloyl esterase family alpha/beta hydrolase [Novosphingobium sediminicola]MBB3953785.1 feruloyl esterase [Novosphingobium sediminicola]
MKRISIGALCASLALAGQGMAQSGPGPGLGPGAPKTLTVVRPVSACGQLAHLGLEGVTDAPARITSATEVETEKGRYCRVEGTVDPAIAFTVSLPMERWTQRLLENAMGRQTPSQAGDCAPALNGEMAVASARSVASSGMGDAAWTDNAQMRIDYAYRGNHQTALVAKALIRAYYGQAPRYSYFMGCSEGGRQALMEAQRYPDDFDGVSAGAPVAIDSIHNAFYHPWEDHVNRRADGSRILAAGRLGLLHDAVMRHCAAVSGVIDGTLQQPTACHFQRAWVECGKGADPAACLTAEEVGVVERLYAGPSDGQGHYFEISGWPLGSEKSWKLSTATQFGDRETKEGFALRRLLFDADSMKPASQLDSEFAYTQGWYDRLLPAAGLFNAANTDLAPFRARGGRLILWHGAQDVTVQPAISIAYYQGVQQAMGKVAADEVMRFFLFPGMAHCVGGEGATQIDLLSPLMAWVEGGKAPDRILADAVESGPMGGGGPQAGPALPYAPEGKPALFSRPVPVFPDVARYDGKGPVKDAASYGVARSTLRLPQTFPQPAASLIAPNNQPAYRAGEKGIPVISTRS